MSDSLLDHLEHDAEGRKMLTMERLRFAGHIAELAGHIAELQDCLKIVLLFHLNSRWDAKKREQFFSVTGACEATKKTMCDHIRKVLDDHEEEAR